MPTRTSAASLLIALAACQAPLPVTNGVPWPDPLPTREAVPAGTTILLQPATIGLAATRPSGAFLDGLWRTAMLQSARFDFAAGEEACPSDFTVRLHYEPQTRTLTTTLRRGAAAPVPLAAVRGQEPGHGLDILAWHTRSALGEDVRAAQPAPVACTVAYSADRSCIRFTELGRKALHNGDAHAARKLFQTARRHDPASPETAVLLAIATANQAGDRARAEAARIAKTALDFDSRLTLATGHRLAKILLLAAGQGADARLLQLGEEYHADRPHDPHGRFTIAHAHCLLGNYRKALPLLDALRRRWPKNAPVRYQLAFAQLATGDAEGALTALEEARRRLPAAALVRPFAMALYHAGKHDELRRFLQGLRKRPGIAGTEAEREVMRMQASHALLTGRRSHAAAFIAEGFAWLRDHNSELERYALDVVEDGEVLARLGDQKILANCIDGFLQLGQLPASFANSVTYLGGLLTLLREREPTRALATLQQSHDSVLYRQLEAAAHRRGGELKAETAALKRIVSRTDDALAYANYARALTAAGDRKTARRMANYVRERLLSFNQRTPRDHPLMTPGRAMAFLATAE